MPIDRSFSCRVIFRGPWGRLDADKAMRTCSVNADPLLILVGWVTSEFGRTLEVGRLARLGNSWGAKAALTPLFSSKSSKNWMHKHSQLDVKR